MCAKRTEKHQNSEYIFLCFCLAPACDILYIIKYYIFLRKLLTNLTAVVYYYYDHKVGVVGVLCPHVKNEISLFLTQRHNPVKQNKCSVGIFAGGPLLLRRNGQCQQVGERQASLKKTFDAFSKFFRIFVLFDWGGQYLSSLIKCVGAKCTKRCCRVQLWLSAQRSMVLLFFKLSAYRSPLMCSEQSSDCALYISQTDFSPRSNRKSTCFIQVSEI